MARTQNPVSAPESETYIDPDSVPETLCLGPFHVLPHEPTTITFTHSRPKPHRLLEDNLVELEHIVRARIVLSRRHLIALRDVLNRVLDDDANLDSGGGGASIH
jgi:hypothetical protein